MKINLLKNSLLFLTICLLSTSLFAQEHKSSKISSFSNIISTTHLDTSTTTIVSFDYLNYSWDTLFTVNDYNAGEGSFSAYDSYHRKYFYYNRNYINANNITTSFYSLDLYTQQIDSLFSIENTNALDMLYDIYTNSLLVRVKEEMLEYNLTTNSLSTLMAVPYANSTYESYHHFYNNIKQKYTYQTESPITSWVSTNIKDLFIDSVIINTMIDNMYSPAMITFDKKREIFIGFAKNKITHQQSIVSIDNNPNYTAIICNVPTDYNSHLNDQKASFDSERALYLLPYYTNSSTSKLAIVNVNDSSNITTPFSALTNHHYLDNIPDPIIKLEDSLLKANWYPNYSWEFNGNLIPQSNNIAFVPTMTGWYTMSTIRPDNSIASSNSIYVAFANIEDTEELSVSVLVYPNPAKDFIALEIISQEKAPKNIDITLYDISGKLIKQIENNDYMEKTIIPTENLNSGIYMVSIKYNDIIINKKIIISK